MKRESMPLDTARSVPGTYGLPGLGWLYDTADFFLLRGWKAFFLTRQRKHGSVFRCHALMKTVAVLDQQGFEPLFNWDGRLKKEDGFGWAKAPAALTGATTLSIFAEGTLHAGPKGFYMDLLKARAPELGASFRTVAAEYFARWERGMPFGWSEEIERFYASFFFEWLLDLRPSPDEVRLLYNHLFGHVFWRLTRFIPWSRYSCSVPIFRKLLALVRNSKRFREEIEPIARAHGVQADEAAKQLLFTIGVNCYLGLQSLTRSAVAELSRHPELLAAMRAEIHAALGKAPDIELRQLARVPSLDQFLNEVLRLHPPVFFIFGRAVSDFELGIGSDKYAIKAGERLMGVIPLAQRDPALFEAPDEFRPARFEAPDAARALVWPHGRTDDPILAHTRICAGRDLGIEITRLFCATLLRTYEWTLQRAVSWDERRFTLNVAAPSGPLKVARFARLLAAKHHARTRTNRDSGPLLLQLIRTRPIAWFFQAAPFLRRLANRWSVNFLVYRTLHRPYPYSLWTPDAAAPLPAEPYVSWTGLVDRGYTGRHLPPAGARPFPDIGAVRRLFERQGLSACHKSSALFSFFAQWFTDSFLRTDPYDPRRNTSNHDIDLCQIYGLNADTTKLLRARDGTGRLRTDASGCFPARLFDAKGEPEPSFASLSYVQRDERDPAKRRFIDVVLARTNIDPAVLAQRRGHLYASGLERGNSSILYAALSTVFLREHNRICGELQRAHPGWDDDRLFETARNVNIVLLLRIIVEEYINHIADERIRFLFDGSFAERQRWYRMNRIMLEFNLLYRWHALVPDSFLLRGKTLPAAEFMVNNVLLEKSSAEAVIAAASRQSAGRIGLHNTPAFLLDAEQRAVEFARQQRVASYNEYCKRFRVPQCRSFDDLTGDPALAADLESLYGDVENLELVVGLYAERHAGMLGGLMRAMVAVDAFSHALTNPLLARNTYGEQAFARKGLEIINETTCLADLVRRNKAPAASDDLLCSFAI